MLHSRKIKGKFRLDEDFFRTDMMKQSGPAGEFVSVKLNLQSHPVVSISCGFTHALLLTDAGQVFSMYIIIPDSTFHRGVGTQGRLGHGNSSGCNEPKLVPRVVCIIAPH